MKLVSVYQHPRAEAVLYQLMEERDTSVNISHQKLPTWEQHVAFVRSRPYAAWYLAVEGVEPVGAVYLTHDNEIGVFILRAHQKNGFGPEAVRSLCERHPRPRFLANINPSNTRSIGMFKGLGFHLLQSTYELRP